jgi:complex iron-sulfur molybdoenzyme family reductase subunit gamma
MNARLLGRGPVTVAGLAGLAVAAAVIFNALGIQLAASQTATLQSHPLLEAPALDPMAPAWDDATPLQVPVTSSVAGLTPSAPSATLRAINTTDRVYIRLDWEDGSRNDQLTTITDFSDSAALEFPAAGGVTAPAICMGQADSAVNIWHWKAVLQGGGLAAWDLTHPRDSVDANPFDDTGEPELAYPARAVGNPISGTTGRSVLDLTATAFGTLSPTASQLVNGQGVWQDGRWYVVFERELSVDAPDEVALKGGALTDMAVAIWDGSQGDRDGQKAVSQFVKLAIPSKVAAPTDVGGGDLFLMLGVPGLMVVAAGAVAFFLVRTRRSASGGR